MWSSLPASWTDPSARPESVVVLFRHGRTEWNATGRFLGRTDLGLDEVGQRQAAGLRRWSSRFERVYTSPLRRACSTAVALAPPDAVPDDDLVEVHQGDLEGLPVAEGMARWPEFFAAFARDPSTVRIPGGETLPEAASRVGAALERWAAAHPQGLVGAVGHQMAIASFAARSATGSTSAWRAFRLDHGDACVFVRDGGAFRVAAKLAACEDGG